MLDKNVDMYDVCRFMNILKICLIAYVKFCRSLRYDNSTVNSNGKFKECKNRSSKIY